jgi:thiamine-phosphate pyrophosphorylase
MQLQRGLYLITPEALHAHELLRAVEEGLAGGAVLLQYRAKSKAIEQRRTEARALSRLCGDFEVPLVINDDLALAVELGAGLHLGEHDGSVLEARRQLGIDAVVGSSCYNDLERARQAEQQQCSYVAFGAFFKSPTKPHARIANPELITDFKSASALPVVAIGGIKLEQAQALVQAGADLLAVISDVFEAADIRRRARQYAALFEASVA